MTKKLWQLFKRDRPTSSHGDRTGDDHDHDDRVFISGLWFEV